MPKITSVETYLIDIPTIRAHELAMTRMNGQSLMLVKIKTSEGIDGWGEGTTIGGLAYGPECPEGMKLVIDTYMAPLLIGQEASFVQVVMDRVRASVKGNNFAKCALETALLDAEGKRLNQPISSLLGGRRRDALEIVWTLASGDTVKDIGEARAMLEARRHRHFKLKIGRRAIRDDVRHVAEIRKALPEDASVRVDVNAAWSPKDAAYGIAALADAGCTLIEQPVTTLKDLARLSAQSPVPLMADEILTGPESAFDAAASGAGDVFSVKTEQAGGLYAARAVVNIAEAAGIAVYGGTMLEGPVGTIAAAHLFAGVGALPYGTELFGPLLLTESLLTEPLVYKDFQLIIPTGPGLGIQLDQMALHRFRRDRAPSVGDVARNRG